ncbi:MAG: hypothetical protein HXX16_00860 [Bacteroidales bacterium]|nr:hypothetical protein [Bacteroidales bacterium]
MDASQKAYELDKIGTQFDQFIIAVNGALIAYAFKQVENKELTLDLIPLGLAIICWGLGFYYGVTSIRRIISTRIIEIFKDTSSITRQNPEYAEITKRKVNEVVSEANSYNKRMFKLLYLGGCLFILWQIIEMYLRTNCR